MRLLTTLGSLLPTGSAHAQCDVDSGLVAFSPPAFLQGLQVVSDTFSSVFSCFKSEIKLKRQDMEASRVQLSLGILTPGFPLASFATRLHSPVPHSDISVSEGPHG